MTSALHRKYCWEEPLEEEEEDKRDEHAGLQLRSSGAISHPVEENYLRETRAAATKATVGSC